MAEKTIKTRDLIQDDRNLNRGTERGRELINTSVGRYGAGRSIPGIYKDNAEARREFYKLIDLQDG